MSAIGRPAITASALAIIDTDGPSGLTMRRLADRLGVTATAIYYHFPGRQAILDAVADELADAVSAAAPTAGDPTVDWTDRIESALVAWYERTKLNPVAMGWMMGTYAFEPPMLRLHETLLEILAASGYSDDELLLLKGALLRIALGHFVIDEQRHGKPTADAVPAEFARYRSLSPAMDRFDVDEQFRRGVRAVLAGWASTR